MNTDYRIQETIHASGRSAWCVEFLSRPDSLQQRTEVWKVVCFVDSKKLATEYIKMRRGNEIVDIKYHEVPR